MAIIIANSKTSKFYYIILLFAVRIITSNQKSLANQKIFKAKDLETITNNFIKAETTREWEIIYDIYNEEFKDIFTHLQNKLASKLHGEKEKPKNLLLTSSKNITEFEGNTVLLTCESETNYNTTKILWALKGEKFPERELFLGDYNEPRYNFYLEFNLKIENFKKDDVGIYFCDLEYFNNQNERSRQSIVYDLQLSDENSTDNTIKIGQKVKFAINETVILPCQILRLGKKHKVQWTKRSKNDLQKEEPIVEKSPTGLIWKDEGTKERMRIIEGTTLEIQNLKIEDGEIEYICKARDSKLLRKESAKMRLKIDKFPNKTLSLKNRCLPSLCGLNSECKFENNHPECKCRKGYTGNSPNCKPDWKQKKIPDLVCMREECKKICEKSCKKNAECTIQNYKFECTCLNNHFGDPYHECYNRTKFKKHYSKSSVIVNGVSTDSNKIHKVYRNSSVVLGCETFSKLGELSNGLFLKWKKTPVNATFRYNIDELEPKFQPYKVHHLLFENIQPNQSNYYICHQVNSLWIAYKLEIGNETNIQKPDFITRFATVKAEEGDNVTLPCEAVDFDFSFNWQNYNQTRFNFVSYPNIKILHGLNLEIQNVQPEDAGNFTCVMKSDQKNIMIDGEMEVRHQLIVLDSVDEADPCKKYPCGENFDCIPDDNYRKCVCRQNYVLKHGICEKSCNTDPSCRSMACVSERCEKICKDLCGNDSTCRVQNYTYTCTKSLLIATTALPAFTGYTTLQLSTSSGILFVFVIVIFIFIQKIGGKSTYRSPKTCPLSFLWWKRLPKDPDWELPKDRFTPQYKIGKGNTGKVLKAKDNLENRKVAIKKVKKRGSRFGQKDLNSEFEVLKNLEHDNVVRLLGVCTFECNKLWIIMELAEHGSLRNYLINNKKDLERELEREIRTSGDPNHLTFLHGRIHDFALQIAKGMQYIHDKGFLHRDLAARNVLVTENLICKIADFGLSRNIVDTDGQYIKQSKRKVPTKWVALEGLQGPPYKYTTKSDVWSYGILLWELITFGREPYPGIRVANVAELVINGQRMRQPRGCPNDFYEIMFSCWNADANHRPEFWELINKIKNLPRMEENHSGSVNENNS